MKIAYVAPRYAPFIGGTETQVAQLAIRMAAAGHQVDVLTQESQRDFPALQVIHGVTVHRFPLINASQHYAFAPRLWQYLAQHHRAYDIVHAFNYHALPALAAASVGCQPLVLSSHYHGGSASKFRRLLHKPYRIAGALVFNRCTQILCDTPAEAVLIAKHFPHAAGRLKVIPLGVDTSALHTALPFRTESTVILSVGRLEDYKNVELTIHALAYLDTCCTLHVIGSGPARAELERAACRLNVQDRVRFHGQVDQTDLYRWYQSATVYVSMSHHEAFGIALLEALGAGAMTIASDIAAHRAIAAQVEPGAVSLLPIDTSPQHLAQVLRARIKQPHSNVPRSVTSWDDVAQQTWEVYNRLHSTRSGGIMVSTKHRDDSERERVVFH